VTSSAPGGRGREGVDEAYPAGYWQLERRMTYALRAGVGTLVAGNVAFVYGLSRFLGRGSTAELCAQRGQPYRPEEASTGGLLSGFPVSMPCNADYDLVPVWMLPLTVIGTALAVAAFAYFLLLRRRQAALWAATDGGTL